MKRDEVGSRERKGKESDKMKGKGRATREVVGPRAGTGQPEPNQHDLTTLRRIQYSQEEGPGHISRGSTKFD
jgi:hypothetical protein